MNKRDMFDAERSLRFRVSAISSDKKIRLLNGLQLSSANIAKIMAVAVVQPEQLDEQEFEYGFIDIARAMFGVALHDGTPRRNTVTIRA